MKMNKIVLCSVIGLIGGGATISSTTNRPIVVKAATKNQINSKINKQLKECQDWATSRKDKNGKESKDATTNLAYQWSTYVTSLQYNGRKKLTITVNNNFDDLQDNAKRDTLNSAENCANQVLIEQKKISAEDANKGLIITVRDGNGVVGRSDKLSNRLYDFN